jgi:SAM-dependent methyltransferase
MSVKSHIKSLVRASPILYSTRLVYANLRKSLSYNSGDISRDGGGCHLNASLKESIQYINDVFHDYKYYGGIDKFYGKVAEVGTGYSCGIGILFLRDGCDHVDLIDKYCWNRSAFHESEIVRKLTEANKALIKTNRAKNIYDEENINGLSRRYGPQASAENFFKENKGYDFIVSRAVFEHVDDPEASLSLMAKALNTNGMMLHKVDLRDHGMFTPEHGDLTFLKFSNWYYALMARGSGEPNRVLANCYQNILDSTNLQYKILVTKLVGVGDIIPHVEWEEIDRNLRGKSLSIVQEIQGTLAKDFKYVESKFLAISGIFIVAKK